MKTGLLDLLTQSLERLTILVVDGSEYLAQLRTLYPNAEIHAVTPYGDIAAHCSVAHLSIHWHVLDWRCDPLPFCEEMFDRIIAEFAIESAYEPYDTLMTLTVSSRKQERSTQVIQMYAIIPYSMRCVWDIFLCAVNSTSMQNRRLYAC